MKTIRKSRFWTTSVSFFATLLILASFTACFGYAKKSKNSSAAFKTYKKYLTNDEKQYEAGSKEFDELLSLVEGEWYVRGLILIYDRLLQEGDMNEPLGEILKIKNGKFKFRGDENTISRVSCEKMTSEKYYDYTRGAANPGVSFNDICVNQEFAMQLLFRSAENGFYYFGCDLLLLDENTCLVCWNDIWYMLEKGLDRLEYSKALLKSYAD